MKWRQMSDWFECQKARFRSCARKKKQSLGILLKLCNNDRSQQVATSSFFSLFTKKMERKKRKVKLDFNVILIPVDINKYVEINRRK